jgi:hypothetical protein
METYATDHNGSYTGATEEALETIEPSLKNASFDAVTPNEAGDGYTITIEGSKATQTFSVVNNKGSLEFTCTTEKVGGCPAGGKWN